LKAPQDNVLMPFSEGVEGSGEECNSFSHGTVFLAELNVGKK
jgi:hypothetical protein